MKAISLKRRVASLETIVLFLAALIISFTGVAYELLLATYATYLWGGSLFQYSLVFSSMMLAMGIGAWWAEKVKWSPLESFVGIEVALAWLGMLCLPVLYWVYWKNIFPVVFTFLFSLGFGCLVGFEIPLLNRILNSNQRISHLLAFDFAGGFLGGVLFPLFLVPHWGLFRVAGFVAVLNALVAVWATRRLRKSSFVEITTWLTLVISVLFCFLADETKHYLQWKFFGF